MSFCIIGSVDHGTMKINRAALIYLVYLFMSDRYLLCVCDQGVVTFLKCKKNKVGYIGIKKSNLYHHHQEKKLHIT